MGGVRSAAPACWLLSFAFVLHDSQHKRLQALPLGVTLLNSTLTVTPGQVPGGTPAPDNAEGAGGARHRVGTWGRHAGAHFVAYPVG